MNTFRMMSVLVMLAMLFSFANFNPGAASAGSPAIAKEQSSVRGHGKVQLGGDELSISEISVNAWLDDKGVAHGMMNWVGGVPPGELPKTGPADPWHINVTTILFVGNTAYVCGVVAHSVFPEAVGLPVCFLFTDNSETGTPDEIGGGVVGFGFDSTPIVAGNIIIVVK